jgi:23S rRNA pseudouridine1911/1915/1917 synthase
MDEVNEKEVLSVIVDDFDEGQRLDRFCTDKFDDFSRERIKQLIANGGITVDGVAKLKPSMKIEDGWVISCTVPEADDADPEPENIPLNIIYEDDDVIVLNKAAGMVVHPAQGNWTGKTPGYRPSVG